MKSPKKSKNKMKTINFILLNALIIIFVAGSKSYISAQPEKELKVDKITYRLFTEQNWEQLIDTGKAALFEDVDFYYLRIRMGIAYYNLKNYMTAISHFEKACEFYPKDTVAMEYLYYSYLFSGRSSDAHLTAEKFPSALRNRLRYTQLKFTEGAYFEAGYTSNMDFNDQKKTDITGLAKIYGEQTVLKGYGYGNFNLIHNIGNRIKVFHGVTGLMLNSQKIFDEPYGGFKEFKTETKQFEYFINGSLNLGSGFGLAASYHYFNINADDYSFKYDNPNSGNPKPIYSKTNYSSNENIYSLSFSKYFPHFDFSTSVSYSNLNKGEQIQNGLGFVLYPLGNLNLYIISNFTYFSGKESGADKYSNHWVVKEKIGFKAFDPVWFETSFTYGEILNYNEENGYVVYNNTEPIKSRFEIAILIPFAGGVEFNLRYQNFLLEHSYLTYLDNINFIINKSNYLNNTITGGLKWTF